MNPNDNNLPYNVKYEETTSDLHPANKYLENLKRHEKETSDLKPSPCQLHGEGEESEDELELPVKCIKFDDDNKFICTTICIASATPCI